MILATPPPPLSLLGPPSHPILSVRRDCTARGRYWGAYGSAQGDARLFASLSPLPPSLSIYLSIYPLLFQSTRTRSLSLSLMRRYHPSLSSVSAHPARLSLPPFLYTTPFQPCTIPVRPFLLAAIRVEEGNGLWAGERVTRETS